jgi:type I restriction enzyme, S subunit
MKTASWPRCVIGNLVSDVSTWNPLRATQDCEFEYIDIASIDRETKTIAQTTRTRAQASPSRARQLVRAGDILVSTVRPNLNAVAFVPDALDGATASTGFCVLRCVPDRLNPRYLYHWVRTSSFIGEMVRLSTGASYPAVSDRIVCNSTLPFPPLAEQKRIADILDQADTIFRKRHRVARQADELIPAIFNEMFGSAVTNQRRWELVKVSDAGEVLLGRQRAPKYQSGEYTTPYIRVANVFEDRIDTSDVLSMDFAPDEFARFKLEYGDILLNEGQSTELVGRPAMWRDEIPDCCFQNTLVRFRAYSERTEPEYALSVFLQYLHAGEFAKVSSKTSNVAHLGAGRFGKMAFPLPPLDLQREFARKVEATRSLRHHCREASDESGDLLASLVQRGFRGEL